MKRVLRGTVTSDKRDKTLRVDIERRFRHRKYAKIVRSRLGCQVHDPENVARMGDLVEIIESPPLSKTKRWQLVRVLQAASDASVAAGEVHLAAAKADAEEA
jgi:small subunit ribosomal protein S17